MILYMHIVFFLYRSIQINIYKSNSYISVSLAIVILEAFALAEAYTTVLTSCAYYCSFIDLPIVKESCCTLGKYSESRNRSINKLQTKISILFKYVFISHFSFVQYCKNTSILRGSFFSSQNG